MLAEFFRDKTPARLLMLAAIVLLFVSQFFLYFNDEGAGYITNAMDLEHYTQVVFTGGGGVGTGWERHPHAYVLLVILAFAFFRDDFLNTPLFSKLGWWVAVVMVFASATPGAPLRDAPGAAMGMIAALIALVAAVQHGIEVRAARDKAAADKTA